MSNTYNNVLYIGVTNDLYRRVIEHKSGEIKGFTQKYNCNKLVYFEEYKSVEEAIARESQLKNWKREWKNVLIEKKESCMGGSIIGMGYGKHELIICRGKQSNKPFVMADLIRHPLNSINCNFYALLKIVINEHRGMADQVRHDSNVFRGMADQARHNSNVFREMADQVRHDNNVFQGMAGLTRHDRKNK